MGIVKKTILTALIATFASVTLFNYTQATPVVGFEAGNIIDDVVFTNNQSMNISQIQAFLNSKVPICDTWHAGFYGTSGTWYGPPFTCLKDYSENGLSAAQIISNAAQTYKINPQVLLVLLQKEQSLITDTWPASYQYKTATGYGCPDGAPCNELYYGFTNQVNNAANMFRKIMDTAPTWYTPYSLGSNYIQYNPDAGCGGTIVNIQNRSTQALYNYTPYQPNASVINAGYGLGDSCGAYGNRNFYLFFTDWFGSTKDRFGYSFLALSSSLSIDSTNYYQNKEQTVSFTINNSSNLPVVLGESFISVRGPQGQNVDITSDKDVSVPANGNYTFSKKWSSPYVGYHDLSIAFYKQNLGYTFISPMGSSSSIVRSLRINVKPSLRIVSSLSVSPSQPIQNSPYTATYSIRNDSDKSVDIGYPFVSVRGPQGQILDVGINTNERIVVPANSTYNYSKQWTTSVSGQHALSVVSWVPEKNQMQIIPVDDGISRNIKINVKPSLRIVSSLSVSPSQPIQNSPYTATYSIRNDSDKSVDIGYPFVSVRGPQGQILDVGINTNERIVVPANSTYNYSKQWTTSVSGQHALSVVSWVPEKNQMQIIPVDDGISRNIKINVKPSLRIVSSLSVSPSQPIQNSPYTATYSIRNDSDKSVDIGYPFVSVRGPQGQILDVGINTNERIVVPANSTYNYSKQWTTSVSGQHALSVVSWVPEKNQMQIIPVDDGIARTATFYALAN